MGDGEGEVGAGASNRHPCLLNHVCGVAASARHLVLKLGEAGEEFAIGLGEHPANAICQSGIDEGIRASDDVADLEQSGDIEVHACQIE